MNICSIENCGRVVSGYGLCKNHYNKQYRPNAMKEYWARTAPERRKKCNEYARTIKGQYRTLKNNAKNKGHEIDLSFEQFQILRSKPCHYCGGSLSETAQGLDRKDNSLGYTISNSVPCCPDCNYTKGSRITYPEMLSLIAFRNESLLTERLISEC